MDWDERLQLGKLLSSKQMHHAALEIYNKLSNEPCAEIEKMGILYDEMGKIHLQLSDFRQATDYFSKAVSCTQNTDSYVLYTNHLAITYKRRSDYDKAQRTLSRLLEYKDRVSPKIKGLLFANLALIQGLTMLHEEGILNVRRSLEFFEQAGIHVYHPGLYNNLGLLFLETGNYMEAEHYLKRALELRGNRYLLPITELSRLFMLRGDLAQSVSYAEQALSLVWSSLINYEKEEIARLCYLLASLTVHSGERETALRLIEKSQLFFGQLGMWREWQQVEAVLEKWTESPRTQEISLDAHFISFDQIRQFLNLLDALNSQELIHQKISKFLDIRVHYAKILGDALGLSSEEQEHLVYACRFADFGLTALEPEVALNPTRSEQAWNQYKEHPSLSIRMLQSMHMSNDVMCIIADHHENFNGTGYPKGKKETEISRLAQIFTVVNFYTEKVSLYDQPHSEALNEMIKESGISLHPDIVEVFQSICVFKE